MDYVSKFKINFDFTMRSKKSLCVFAGGHSFMVMSRPIPQQLVTKYQTTSTINVWPLTDPHIEVRHSRQQACCVCEALGRTYPSGQPIKTHYRCEACTMPLCIRGRDCFQQFHKLIAANPLISPDILLKSKHCIESLLNEGALLS